MSIVEPAPNSSRSYRRSRSEAARSSEVAPWESTRLRGPLQWLAVVWILLVAAFGLSQSPGVSQPFPGLTVAAGGLSAIVGAFFFSRFTLTWRASRSQWLMLLWLLWGFLCCTTSLDSFRSLQSVSAWVGGAGLFLLFPLISTSSLHWRALTWGLSLVATAITLYGLSHISDKGQLVATFSNRDSFAVIPLIGFFFALSQTQWVQFTPIRYVAWAQALIMGLAVGRSSSRAAAFGLVFGLVVTGLFLQLDKNKSRRKKIRRSTLLGLTALLVLSIASGVLMPLMVRVQEYRKGEDVQGVTMREDVLVYGLQTSFKRPILGSGPGTFSLAYQEFRPQSAVPDYIYVNVAHDDPVEVVVEYGWPGFFLMTCIWALVASRALRLSRQGHAPWEASALVGGLGALTAFSALNFIIALPVLLFWQMLALGALQAIPIQPPQTVSGTAPLRRLAALGLALMGIWACFFGVQNWRANHQLARAEALAKELRWEEALQCADRALKIMPQPKAYALRGNLRANLARFKGRKGDMEAVAADLERAAHLSPRDPKIARSRLLFYQSTKRLDKAEEILIEMRKHSPYEEWHVKELVRLQLLQKKFLEAARTIYKNAANDSEAINLLAPILITMESAQPGDAITLLREWSAEEEDIGRYGKIALTTAEYALAKSAPAVAERIATFVVETDPESAHALYLLTRAYGMQGKPLKRREFLNRLVSLPARPRNEKYLDLALVEWARSQKGKTPDSILIKLQKRLKDNPNSPAVRLFLSNSLLENGQIDQATEIISQGLDYAPEDARLLARMGTCLLGQGLGDMAADFFSQALKVDPGNVEARSGSLKIRKLEE